MDKIKLNKVIMIISLSIFAIIRIPPYFFPNIFPYSLLVFFSKINIGFLVIAYFCADNISKAKYDFFPNPAYKNLSYDPVKRVRNLVKAKKILLVLFVVSIFISLHFVNLVIFFSAFLAVGIVFALLILFIVGALAKRKVIKKPKGNEKFVESEAVKAPNEE